MALVKPEAPDAKSMTFYHERKGFGCQLFVSALANGQDLGASMMCPYLKERSKVPCPCKQQSKNGKVRRLRGASEEVNDGLG